MTMETSRIVRYHRVIYEIPEARARTARTPGLGKGIGCISCLYPKQYTLDILKSNVSVLPIMGIVMYYHVT